MRVTVTSPTAFEQVPLEVTDLSVDFSCNTLPPHLGDLLQLRRLSLKCAEAFNDLGPLRALSGLREVRVQGAHRLADVSPLQALHQLEVLELSSVYDVKRFDALAQLPALRTLVLQRTPVDDEALRVLSKLGALTSLDVSSCHRYQGDGFEAWVGHPALRSLDVSSSGVTTEAFAHIAQLPLTSLNVSMNDALGDEAMALVATMKTLTDLRLDLDNELSGAGVRALFEALPNALTRYRLTVSDDGRLTELSDPLDGVTWSRQIHE